MARILGEGRVLKESLEIVKKKSVFSHSKNYMLAELFNKGIAFLTIPIFTRLLNPSEYGTTAIVSSVTSSISF